MFSRIGKIIKERRLQIKFRDRANAAKILALMLKTSIKGLAHNKNVLVIGIARGGIIVGDVIASELSLDFDIVITQKLRDIDNKEVAIGAILEDGTTYLNQHFIDLLEISDEYIQKEKEEGLKEIQRRTEIYKNNQKEPSIKDKTVILVDDGVATGSTLIAAARWLRKRQPHNIIIAVPVAQPQVFEKLKDEADDVIVVSKPSNFLTVGQFYGEFNPVEDDHIIRILKKRGLK